MMVEEVFIGIVVDTMEQYSEQLDTIPNLVVVGEGVLSVLCPYYLGKQPYARGAGRCTGVGGCVEVENDDQVL